MKTRKAKVPRHGYQGAWHSLGGDGVLVVTILDEVSMSSIYSLSQFAICHTL